MRDGCAPRESGGLFTGDLVVMVRGVALTYGLQFLQRWVMP